MRSHDQYNTTIYGLNDRYRGVFGRRDVVFMSRRDLEVHGLADGDMIDIEAIAASDARTVHGFTAVAYDIPPGSVAGYYPEMNQVIVLSDYDKKYGTPAYKGVPVKIRRSECGLRLGLSQTISERAIIP